MSGLIKGTTTGWGGFALTAMVYMLIDGLADLIMWLLSVGKSGFDQATLYDWILIGAKILSSMLFTLRALMNGSFGEAKGQPHST